MLASNARRIGHYRDTRRSSGRRVFKSERAVVAQVAPTKGSTHIPDEPTAGVEYFRPGPLPRAPFPDNDTQGYLVLLADAQSLSLDEVDTLSDEELEVLALSPLELVVGGIATPESMLGQGLLADARDRFHTNRTHDEYGLMTVGLMYLETGSGVHRRTYSPADLVLQSFSKRLAGDRWRPWYAQQLPTVPDHWVRL